MQRHGWPERVLRAGGSEVRISGVGDVQAGIDNFNLVGEVPEPSTYAMMLGGLGLLALGRRKRKSS